MKINYKIFLKKRKQRISFFSISPSFDWKFILVFSFVIFLIGAFYLGNLYLKILDESLFVLPVDEQQQLHIQKQEEIVKKTVEKIDIRNKNTNLLNRILPGDNLVIPSESLTIEQ
jgi:hypothetical protein